MATRPYRITSPIHEHPAHQVRKIRWSPAHDSQTMPSSSGAPQIGQNRGRSSRWRSASGANHSPGGGSWCGSTGRLESATGAGLSPRHRGSAVQRQQLFPDRRVPHRAAVDPLVGEGRPGAELVLLARQLDDLVRDPHRPERIAAAGRDLHVLLEHLAQHRQARIAAAEVLLRPVHDRSLGHPGHDVLALDVVRDHRAVVAPPGEFVDDRPVLALPRSAVRMMQRVEQLPGVGVVDRHPDLHLVHPLTADPHPVGENHRVADLPVVVFVAVALQHPPLDDPVLEFVECHLDVLLLERFRRLEAAGLAEEVEIVPVQPFHVMRVDGVLHDLQPVARQRAVADVADAVEHVDIEPRQLGRRVGADVHPDHPAERQGLARLRPDPVAEIGVLALGWLFQALAVESEPPAVIAAADAVGVHHAVGQRGAAVRTALGDDAVPAGRGLVQRPVLAEQPHGLGRPGIEILLERDRIPVTPQQRAHRRARPDAGQLYVLFDGEHVRPPGQSMTVTVPAFPSTRTRWPVLILVVPNAVPVTAGRPYSRQTMAAWLIIPPTSVTVATILPKMGAQLGAVSGAIRTSPGRTSPIWSAPKMTRAGPSATTGDAPKPETEPSAPSSDARSQPATLSEVIPHSMTVNGSVTTSGGTPSAGGALHSRSAARMALRRWICGCQ